MAGPLVLTMRRLLSGSLPQPAWPDGVRRVDFVPDRHARAVHALLRAAYRQGGGYVEPFGLWWPSLQGDAEYDPALCLVAVDGRDEVVGVAQCWTGAFVKDLAVAPDRRRQGLGAALLSSVLHVFRERGAEFVALKVRSDNPTGAIGLYLACGFAVVESYRADEGRRLIPKACSMAGLPSRSTR